ncbi:hydroxyethylthiazole kinase [Virgibacillus sp. W0181]|uniref:hydroxyethylthiazole kinase n=1 Tax=Virgibacillus sp. W0181 TaxID=3391581 RepID=UPI003F44F838
MKEHVIKNVRKNNPLIHHLTNQVVMNFTANGLLAFGGSPVMAKAKEEAASMAAIADGVLINIGTLTADELQSMIKAGKSANQKGVPIVLDPVGAAATPFRTDALKEILSHVRPTVIKGNAGEMAHLVNIPWETKGVDSVGTGNVQQIVEQVAKTYETVAVVTGETDLIHTGKKLLTNQSGHPMLTKITGAGCLLGSILSACLTTDDKLEDQVVSALHFYGLAAEYAASQQAVNGAGTFLPVFLDALSMNVKALLDNQ